MLLLVYKAEVPALDKNKSPEGKKYLTSEAQLKLHCDLK